MANHLVIGLGGTGGKILRALRKRVFQTLRSESPDPDLVRLDYLYVDSEPSLMALDDDTWKALGRSVQLSNNQQLLIDGMDLATVVDNVNDFPGVKPWVGDRTVWRSLLKAGDGAKIAGGQKRRLGRFLLANRITDFNRAVSRLVRDMTAGGHVGVTFHVCAGLAGGTGSGTVVDVVAQLRAKYPDQANRIIVYALLPEDEPNPDWADDNYHANGYAALRELNALAVGPWAPHDISGTSLERSAYGAEAARMDVADPFNVCYVFTDENAANYRVPVDGPLPEVVAAFLYHKVVTAAEVGGDGLGQISRQERFEMRGGARGVEGEREYPDGPTTRSCRFFSFGVKQIAYPEEEILEYLAFSFAEQAALQLRYNHWSDAVGYTDVPRNQSFDQYVRESRERWRITDDHLTLSRGLLDDERDNVRWRTLESEWASVAENFLVFVQEEPKKELWLDRLGLLFEKHYADEFRDDGVPTFYGQRRQKVDRYVREIRALIEDELLDAWRKGLQSMTEIAAIFGDLRGEFERRRGGLAATLADTRDEAKLKGERARANDAEAAKVGMLGRMVFSTYEKLLKAKAEALRAHYLAQTRVAALEFERDLLGALLNEMDDLVAGAVRAAGRLDEAAQRFRDETASRLTDEGLQDLEQQTVQFYDPDAAKALADRLVRNREVQLAQTSQIRSRIADRVGPSPTLARLNDALHVGALLDLFQEVESEAAREAHDHARSEGGQALLGVNILDKLEEEFGADEARLKQFVHDVVGKAQAFAKMNPQEVGKAVPNAGTPFTTFTVLIPETERHPEFADRLRRAFESAVPSGAEIDIVTAPGRANEITILNVVSSFPVRHLQPALKLRTAYERQRGSGGEAAFVLHGEGTDGTLFPRLYQPSGPEDVVRPEWLLAARALEIIGTAEDHTGRPTLVFEERNEFDVRTGSLALGSTLIEAEDHVTLQLDAAIRDAVIKTVGTPPDFTPGLPDVADRQAAFDRAVAEVHTLQQTYRNGRSDAYGQALPAVQQILHLA